MPYARKIYPSLKKFLNARQAMVITGMRRTGKTTLLRQLMDEIGSDNKLYFDLEKINDRDIFDRKNYDDILLDLESRGLDLGKKITLAIDEIQFLPNITSVIKYLYDHYNIKFLVTGSSSYYLKNLFSQSLAGRKIVFELSPLDFGEFLTFRGVQHRGKNVFQGPFAGTEYERLRYHYEDFLRFGGFPEVVLTKKPELKKALLSDIISSYVNIDIKSLADFRKDKEIYVLIKMLASRIGTRLDYNKLAGLTGLSRQTVEQYTDFLEKTYLITRVPVHTHNPDREIVKARKVYFCDNGLLSVLAENSSGALFENALFNQLRHHGDVRYFSLKNGHEIDFVLDGKTALEAKETPTDTDLADLARLARVAGLKKHALIGRHSSPRFDDFIWGGRIQ